ncbi:MAG: hypothetical protein IJC29_00700 [Clostridia bacterium]|nr:hypothetical protein [Clostridia bacterium]
MVLIATLDDARLAAWQRRFFASGMPTTHHTFANAVYTRQKREPVFLFVPCVHEKDLPPTFFHTYRLRHPDVPVIALVSPGGVLTEDMEEAHLHLSIDLPAHKIIQEALIFASRFAGRDVADLTVGPFRDHLLASAPTWHGTQIPLTPTEHMILRYLMLTYPQSATASELIRNCTKPGTSPTLCNIPTHIHQINRKAQAHVGVQIIGRPDGPGYRLLTDYHD